jgi:hypothetical protein
MILLLTINIIFTKFIMINIHHIAKDSFEPSQGIATTHFYPKHLLESVVQSNRDKILVMSLKGYFLIKFMQYNN